jgi:alpha/beta superfamily hydrolase
VIADGRIDLVAPEGAERAIVVLHPHPDMGGDRSNPVVDAIFTAAARTGWAALRFDFSSSDLATATAEATEVLDRLPAGLPVAVAGYSFGAVVATQVLDPRVDRWVLVAPPLGMITADVGAIAADPRPKLVLAGVHDRFAPPDQLRQATAGWTATDVEEVEGADHFFLAATSHLATRTLDACRAH